jgi:hypothetical protein
VYKLKSKDGQRMKATTQNDQLTSIAMVEDLLTHPSVERTLRRETSDAKSMQSPLARSRKMTHYPAKQREEKRTRRCNLFVVILASMFLFPSALTFALPVSAASYHATRTMANAAAHQAHNSANQAETSQSLGVPWYCHLGPLSLIGKKCRKAPECSILPVVESVILSVLDPRCREEATGDGNPWSFPCSDKDDKGTVDAATIQKDWLSGDPSSPSSGSPPGGGNPNKDEPGHFFVTYPVDTYNLQAMQSLSSIMQGAGFALLTPVILLIGYQLLWASWTYGYARILGLLPQLLLSIMALAASHLLIQMLIDLANNINQGLLALHTQFPFPPITINGDQVPLTLQGDSSTSLRGIIMPISRWGCQANRFVGVLEGKFLSDVLGSAVPFVGGLIKLAGTIVDAVEVVKMIGDLILCVMSISLCAQVLFRIILLNYYILISPVAFACWALPAGVGQGVVNQWFKGFFSLLFVQTFQIFVVVTLPLILPTLPDVPWDGTNILKTVILQLPPIIVLVAVNKVPKLMGTKATAAMGQAGSVASGAVVAMAATAWQIV